MEKMSMAARKEYWQIIRERYWKSRGRARKTQILDEYCRTTGHNRKYVVACLRPKANSSGKAKIRTARKIPPDL